MKGRDMLIIAGIFTTLHVYCTGGMTCCDTPTCKCEVLDGSGILADCSHLGLTVPPNFYNNVSIVNLSYNNFTFVPSSEVFPKGLKELDFSSNNISRFRSDSFKGLNNLTSLNLKYNRLVLNSTIYFKGLFKDLQNLRLLNLKGNDNHKHNVYSYPDDTFMELTSLTYLGLDGLNDRDFGSGFSALQQLHWLDLSGKTGYCELHRLNSSSFRNLLHLTKLDISKCRLIEIDQETFSSLSMLEDLDISYNEELTFLVLQNITNDFRNTSIKIFNFDKIHCTFGLGTELFVKDLKDLKDTNLTDISMSSNRLQLFEFGVLSLLPKTLKRASAADNKLTFGWYAYEVPNLSNLEYLNLSLQYLSHNPGQIRNCIDTVRGHHRGYGSEVSVSRSRILSRNVLHEIQGRFLEDIGNLQNASFRSDKGSSKINVSVPINLKHIFMNNSELQYPVPPIYVSENNIENIYLQNNVLSEWIGPVSNLNSLHTLDLSNNFCSRITSYFFDKFINLQHLYIHDNLLGFNISVDSDNGTFKYLNKLKHLDMSSNRIGGLPFRIFHNLTDLEYLNISDNQLQEWKVKFDHMTHLKYLDLSRNQIRSFNFETTKVFDGMQDLKLDLSGNSIQCNCDTLDFLDWMEKQKQIKFENFRNYTCSTKDGLIISFEHLGDQILNLKKQCNTYIGLITGTVVGILFFVSLVVCGIVYRYRWKLRYLYYMTKNKYKGYAPVRPNDQYEYDAFISYADEDRTFAVTEMQKNLENDGGLSLCLHHRDFLPGNDIAQNVTNAIHCSRKTVCVLSSNFIKSYWCMFEFNMARMESIYSRNGENVLFLIFYDTVAAKDLPLQLMHLIESQSFIEYPNDPHGNVVFWEKMKETLS